MPRLAGASNRSRDFSFTFTTDVARLLAVWAVHSGSEVFQSETTRCHPDLNDCLCLFGLVEFAGVDIAREELLTQFREVDEDG